MPQRPQQKAPFLSFPDTGQKVFRFQFFGRMFISIEIFKVMMGTYIKNSCKNCKQGKYFYKKRSSCQFYPLPFFRLQIIFGSNEIRDRRNDRSYKSKYYEKLAYLTRN
jgi:hypothetical protein